MAAFFYLILTILDLVLIVYMAVLYGRKAKDVGKNPALRVIFSIVVFFVLATAIGAGVAALVGYKVGYASSRIITVAVLVTIASSVFPPRYPMS